jgi:hypothetical protein
LTPRAASLTRYKITVYAQFIPLSGGFMKAIGLIGLRIVSAAALVFLVQNSAIAADWPDWRGPNRDGTSTEKGLPEKWSLQGEKPGLESFLWRPFYPGRPG